jgi:hypothetical protein
MKPVQKNQDQKKDFKSYEGGNQRPGGGAQKAGIKPGSNANVRDADKSNTRDADMSGDGSCCN